MSDQPTKVKYDCSRCPGYCCTYERIGLERKDIVRLGKFFKLTPEEVEKRFTKISHGERVLRHKKDEHFKSACMFLDREKRRCTIYEARPDVCRAYPEGARCGYYEFIRWEREWQDDPDFVPLSMKNR